MPVASELSRRAFLLSLSAGAVLGAQESCTAPGTSLPKPADAGGGQSGNWPPNIIVLLADDLGYGDLSCYREGASPTPHIDALAAEGLRFMDFHSNAAVCSPTRVSVLTGCYPQRFGIENVLTPDSNSSGLPASAPTFAHALKSKGYATGLIGKWHLGYGAASNPLHYGFDSFRGFLSGNIDYVSHLDRLNQHDWWDGLDSAPEEGYTTELITSHAVHFIEDHKDTPFCLYLAHAAPHAPFQGPGDPALRIAGVQQTKVEDGMGNGQTYARMITALDASVGRIVEAIHQHHMEEDTLIFFCSDNGARIPGSNGILRGAKSALFEGGHRVPAIAWWPGKIAPGVTHETAMTMDLAPTLLAAASSGIPAADDLDGVNLLPLLLEGSALPKRTLFWRAGASHRSAAVRRGPWKLNIHLDQTRLYNLDEDIEEAEDLAGIEVVLLNELSDELAAWEARYAAIPVIT